MNDMNNHQVNFQCQVILKIAKVRTRRWTKQESRIKGWIRLDWKKSYFKFRDWNQDLNQRKIRTEVEWSPEWNGIKIETGLNSVPAEVIYSCQAEDIQVWTKGHLFWYPRRSFILKDTRKHHFQRQADEITLRHTDDIYFNGTRISFITEKTDVEHSWDKDFIHLRDKMSWKHQNRVIFFSSTDSLIQKLHTVINPEHCGKTRSTRESHPIQSRVMLQNAIKSQQIDLIKAADYFGNCQDENSQVKWMSEWWKPKRPWSHIRLATWNRWIGRDWKLSEARGFRDRGGILAERMFGFFSPSGAKSLIANRVRFSQCWSEIWSTYLEEVNTGWLDANSTLKWIQEFNFNEHDQCGMWQKQGNQSSQKPE